MFIHRILAISAISLAAATAAHAINVASGFPVPDPSASSGSYNGGSPIDAQLSGLGATGVYGSYDASNVGFAAWEKWSSGSFTSLTPQYTGASGILSASLSQSSTAAALSTSGSNPGLITVGSVDYYGRLTMGVGGGYDFSLSGTSSIAIMSISLQIKSSRFFDEDFNQQIPFFASLNGGTAINPVMGATLNNFSDALSLGTYSNVYTFTWSGLSIAANTPFSLSLESLVDELGFGFSVDSVALSVEGVTAVPEPGTYGLIVALGLGVLILSKRRRPARKLHMI